jgi:hypothetical protein
MAFKLSRKSIRIGTSRVMTLPADWCRYYGDRIDNLTIYGDGILVIAPQGLEKIAQTLIEGKKEK